MLKNTNKNKELVLRKPSEEQQITTTPPKDAVLVLDFDISGVTLTRVNAHGRSHDEGSSLLFTFNDDSKLLLTDFYTAYTKDNMPIFMVEGTLIDGADFFAALDEELMPAAGSGSDATGSGSVVGFLSTLIYDSGVSSLDGLEATLTASVTSPELKTHTTEGGTIEGNTKRVDTLIASADTVPTVPTDTNFPSETTPPSALMPVSISSGNGEMDRVVLTVNGSTIEHYTPTNFSPFNKLALFHNDIANSPVMPVVDVAFGKSVYELEAPQGGYFGILSIEGASEQSTGDGIVFYVHNEYNKDVKLTLTWNASTGEYEARNDANNIFFSLAWDGSSNTLTMEQYRLFTSISTSTTDNTNLDIQFGFVDANGNPITTQTSVSFESIDDYVQYTINNMNEDHLDVTNMHDHEHILIESADMGMQSSSLTLGTGEDRVEINAKKGMDAHKGDNTIRTGEGDDVVIINSDIAMSSSDNKQDSANLISLGDGDDFLLIEGAFEGKNNHLDGGNGDDFIKLTQANLNLEDVFVNNGDGMDVLLLGTDSLQDIEKALQNKSITHTEVIIYGGDQGIANATSKEAIFEELGIKDSKDGLKFTNEDRDKWTENSSIKIADYTAYTYEDAEANKHVTILIQTDSFA